MRPRTISTPGASPARPREPLGWPHPRFEPPAGSRAPRGAASRTLAAGLWLAAAAAAGAAGEGLDAASGMPGQAGDGSLWHEQGALLFQQRKAMRVGDLVTVIIVEEASARNESQLKVSKETGTELGGSGSGKLDFIPLFGGQWDYKKDHQGKGQTSLSGQMSARVTAEVKEVLPDGNYVIEGSRSVKINDDLDRITVRGVVRPEDITAGNTVLSAYLAQAQIAYVGSGPSKNAGRQGLISRILDLLF
ncbi:MAG: flagellar basal body L-ring protein FlgH [Candidatus Eisenbacteria bacterium]|uniref:Flagellar basal body L-ring protein FlgH n=1 Tax=Eiseniibacteriota bacterium TaxID=2212470 RepID=A0A937XC84_UNCEI|nr:flagellar basal body L-ring protein FlgH [Candidatus Eisenbacteria bacterium]